MTLSAGRLPCAPAAGAQTFVKITDGSNPIVTQGFGPGEYYGASWVDADGDGDVDLFINQVGLFRNNGAGSFTRIITAFAGQSTTLGNTWADVDNDGDLDAYTSGPTGVGSSLWRNQGSLSFLRVSTGAIGAFASTFAWGCGFGDYDGDGWIDLVTTGASDFVAPSNPNHLFHNNGNGTFTRIDTTQVTPILGPHTVPTWSDYDFDGDPDLWIATGPANGTLGLDFLFRNRNEVSPGWFQRITSAPLGNTLQDGQMYNWIDYDNDGDLDTYLTNWTGAAGGMVNRLYRNNGGAFAAQSVSTGAIVSDAQPSLSSTWQDFDNDGDLDCLVTNGGTSPNRYYRNNGNATFTALSITNLTTIGPHYCAVSGDYDDDGRMDLFITGSNTTFGLLRNTTAGTNGWLKVRLTGTVSNRAAIGARVRVKAVINGLPVWQLRELSAQNSFNGMNSLEAHFGLGNATLADSILVEWPSGIRMVETNVPAGSRRHIVEDAATAVTWSLVSAGVRDGVVHVEWLLPGSAGQRFDVQRSRGGDAWLPHGEATVDGTQHLRLSDDEVEPGSRHGYRLVSSDGSAEVLGETWVEVPARAEFGIRSLTPNPGPGPFHISCALDARAPARLELVDVTGRKVWSAPLDPASGTTLQRIERPEGLRSGVYFVRLTQHGRTSVRRLAVMD
jgi:hypothetical protein